MEQRIVDLLPKGAARAKVIATDLDLGISEPTLTRQLGSLGTSFNDLLDRLQNDLALKYVRETDLSLAQVAFLLGYANPPASSTVSIDRRCGQNPERRAVRSFSHCNAEQRNRRQRAGVTPTIRRNILERWDWSARPHETAIEASDLSVESINSWARVILRRVIYV